MSEDGYTIQKTFPATLEAIEPFFAEFRLACERLPSQKERFIAELLLREALTNAVLHGSKGDPGRSVGCSLRLEERGIEIVVRDEGEGFDWRQAMERTAAADACSGRGFEILRRYATGLGFNGKGNVVTIRKQF